MQGSIAAVSSRVWWAFIPRRWHLTLLPIFQLLQCFLPPILQHSLSLVVLCEWGRGGGVDVPFSWKLKSYLLLTSWPVMDFCTISHWRKEFLWLKWRAILSYEYKHKYLEANLTMCPFNKIAVVDSFQGLWPLKPGASGQVYSTRHEFPLIEHPPIQPESDWLPV